MIARPFFNQRYIDDTFLLFQKTEHVDEFFHYLNGKHANIKFTVECEKYGKLPFIDTTIHKIANKFESSIFRKKIIHWFGYEFFQFR